MKIARFKYKKELLWGAVEGNDIIVLRNCPFRKIQETSKKIRLNKVGSFVYFVVCGITKIALLLRV